MWKKPAGNFVGCAVPLNAPWSASTSTRSAEDLAVAGSPRSRRACGSRGRTTVVIRFSERSSIHFTGLPVTIEPTTAQHVAGVDADLVAEAAADVGRDHPDLVLGEAGDQRVERAVRVRRLRGRPDRQLAGDLVHVGDRCRRSPSAPGAPAGRACPARRRPRPRRTPRRSAPCRRPPSRRCGCRSGPRCRRGSPARPASSAVRASTTAGSGSYSTSISSSASRAE